MLEYSIRSVAEFGIVARWPSWVRGGSEGRIQLAVGGVGLVVVRHVVSQDIWGVRIGAIGDERVGVGAGDGSEKHYCADCGCTQRGCDELDRCLHYVPPVCRVALFSCLQ